MAEAQTTNHGRRRALLVVGCVAVLTLVTALLGSANPAHAAATLCASSPTGGSATINVSPCQGLTDGATVTITGAGYTPSQNVALFMCNNAPVSTNDCDFDASHQGTGTVDASGNLTGSFTVHSSFTTGGGTSITCNNGSTSPNCTVLAVSSVATFNPGAFMGVGFGAATTTTTTTSASTTTTSGAASTATSTTATTGTVTTTPPPSPTAAAVTAIPTFSG